MANKEVKNSLTNPDAAKRSRYEKLEVAYGTIKSSDWADGDILVLDQIPMLALVHAKFVAAAGNNPVIELFNSSDLDGPIYYNLAGGIGGPVDISYVVSYIRGTGKVQDNGGEAGTGKLIRLQMYVND